MLQVKRESQITFLHSEALDSIPGIVHAFSTRRAERNDFSLGPVSSPNPMIQINRVRFLGAIGAPGWPILKLRQVHSGVVRDMEDTTAAGDAVEGDAAVTSLRGALLGVQTADCAPILIADTHARCVAAIHAGWRGTAAGIAEATVDRLCMKSGVNPAELTAVIGPRIRSCCYEVGEEVVEAVDDPEATERRPEWAKPHLDLGIANRDQLLTAGLSSERIEISSLCTSCRPDLFFSYRRDGTEKAGRLLAVIGILP
jgi:purine-nucleoside/S-methyl-5'-thioadenosine phosphorylase / adenosine deaminase